MRRTLLSLCIVLFGFSLFVQDASARGFGGRSFSGGRSYTAARAQPAFSNTFRKRPTTAPARNNKWKGAFTGFLLGSLLGSLFMGHGLGSGLLSWFVLGALVWFVINWIKRRNLKYSIKQD